MLPAPDIALFALAALIMVLTPGPNMVYVVSRSLCQGRKAGVISLFGVATGFLVHMFAAAAGLTAVFLAIPLAYEVLRWLGAAYLLWLGWQALRPHGGSPFETGSIGADRAVAGIRSRGRESIVPTAGAGSSTRFPPA